MIPVAPLQSLKPPWVHLLMTEQEDGGDRLHLDLPEFRIITLDGHLCETKESLFSEYARAFDFPEYFGGNWDAFEECLSDLEWIPASGYVTLIRHVEHVLPNHDEDYATCIEILQEVGEGWSLSHHGRLHQPPLPFHTLFIVNRDHYRDRHDWKLPMLFPPTP